MLKKMINKETILYLIFGITVTVLNIILFYLFVNFFLSYYNLYNKQGGEFL